MARDTCADSSSLDGKDVKSQRFATLVFLGRGGCESSKRKQATAGIQPREQPLRFDPTSVLRASLSLVARIPVMPRTRDPSCFGRRNAARLQRVDIINPRDEEPKPFSHRLSARMLVRESISASRLERLSCRVFSGPLICERNTTKTGLKRHNVTLHSCNHKYSTDCHPRGAILLTEAFACG
ncbi:hypothetical protein EYF80_015585 [Liparis tanakae]|uniref:Uncharacterized protein n=1 Tax=Liparis tanakae TaxID=230148 RepID=A0A4Z2I8E6_9TELE|nr:hypothetical protein EYF80_015585 [Liparis tanakae]